MQPSHEDSHGHFGGDAAVEVDRPRNIALDTNAWHPQCNGVVSTWPHFQREPALLGPRLQVIQPSQARGPFPP